MMRFLFQVSVVCLGIFLINGFHVIAQAGETALPIRIHRNTGFDKQAE